VKAWERVAAREQTETIRRLKREANASSFALFIKLGLPLLALLWLLWAVNK
jgi:hypothetical protein